MSRDQPIVIFLNEKELEALKRAAHGKAITSGEWVFTETMKALDCFIDTNEADDVRCELCRFWEHERVRTRMGDCHCHAPSHGLKDDEEDFEWGHWFKTGTHDWCGEFKPKATE